jgi:hypothetical protein
MQSVTTTPVDGAEEREYSPKHPHAPTPVRTPIEEQFAPCPG